MDIKVNVRESNGQRPCSVVDLNGEIDVYTSPKVKETIMSLIDSGHYALVINLENVRYIDSTGLGVLIGGLKRVREGGFGAGGTAWSRSGPSSGPLSGSG